MSSLLYSVADHLRKNIPELAQPGVMTVNESCMFEIEDDSIEIKLDDVEIEVRIGAGYALVNRITRNSMGELEGIAFGDEIMTMGFGGNPLESILHDVRSIMNVNQPVMQPD